MRKPASYGASRRKSSAGTAPSRYSIRSNPAQDLGAHDRVNDQRAFIPGPAGASADHSAHRGSVTMSRITLESTRAAAGGQRQMLRRLIRHAQAQQIVAAHRGARPAAHPVHQPRPRGWNSTLPGRSEGCPHPRARPPHRLHAGYAARAATPKPAGSAGPDRRLHARRDCKFNLT